MSSNKLTGEYVADTIWFRAIVLHQNQRTLIMCNHLDQKVMFILPFAVYAYLVICVHMHGTCNSYCMVSWALEYLLPKSRGCEAPEDECNKEPMPS